MDWLKTRWWTPVYHPVNRRDHDSNTENTEESHIRVRHELSYAVTFSNILLTMLTVAVVVFHHEPSRVFTDTNESCNCPNTQLDPRYKNPKLNADIKRVAGYSPLLDEIDLTPQSKVLNGAFHDNTTIYMQDPSPEVDAAWKLFSSDIFLTSWSTVRDSGRSLSKSIHFPPSVDGTAGKYIATWDVFHQIHCLNWLRKSVNWKYYYGDKEPTPVYLMHQRHCIHMLLQSLMCSADVDMVTFEWMEGHDERVSDLVDGGNESGKESHLLAREVPQDAIPAANFNVHKMCRNFSALVEWAQKNKEEDPTQTRKKLRVPGNVRLNKAEDY